MAYLSVDIVWGGRGFIRHHPVDLVVRLQAQATKSLSDYDSLSEEFMKRLALVLLGLLSTTIFAAVPVPVCTDTYFTPAAAAQASVRADGRHFRADDGRYVLLRGVNATGDAKMPPFKTVTSPAVLDPLPGWGINTIRLLFTWEAFEAAPCDYNQDYLDYYEQAVQWAAERDLYVIVDFHQDAFSRYALNGCGEGFPEWALTSQLARATPDNGPACAGWGSAALFSGQNAQAFRRFFEDDNQAYSHYVAMTRRVAARLARYPNVVGYDLLNEPWSDGATLTAFYGVVGAAIREQHPSAMLFFEPESPVIGPLIPVLFAGIKPPPLDNLVLAPHYYDGAVMSVGSWLWISPGLVLSQWKQKADGWNMPMLLGEFGSPANVWNARDYLEAHYQWLDENFVAGTQWSYTPGWTPEAKDGWNREDLSIVDDKMQLRSALFVPRPYPQKTAGLPVKFARGSNGFQYTWINDPTLGGGRTEFYLPAGYAQGKHWQVTPKSAAVVCSVTGDVSAVCESAYSGSVTIGLRR